MVGLFWVIDNHGSAVLIAHAVPLEHAEPYGDMITTDTGHLEYWSKLACRGLRKDGIPTAPVWSEYEGWPRGRDLSHAWQGARLGAMTVLQTIDRGEMVGGGTFLFRQARDS